MGYKMKKLSVDKNDKDVTTCKLACESVYLGLKLLFIQQDTKTPPLFDFKTLYETMSGALTDEQKKWIDELAAQRIKDRNSSWRMTKEFHDFVEQCLESRPKEPSTFSEADIENALGNELANDDDDQDGGEQQAT